MRSKHGIYFDYSRKVALISKFPSLYPLYIDIFQGLGKNGVVKRPEKNGYALVVVGSQTLRVSPAALVPRPLEGGESSTEDTDNTATGKDLWESLLPDPGN